MRARRVAALADVHENAVALDVECPRADHDLDETERRYGESGDPTTAETADVVRRPSAPSDPTVHAEPPAFSG